MANVVVTLKIMPSDPGIDLNMLEQAAKSRIVDFCNANEFKTVIEPIAFGLKALKLMFVMDENKGSTEELETQISKIEGVESIECTDVRRTIG